MISERLLPAATAFALLSAALLGAALFAGCAPPEETATLAAARQPEGEDTWQLTGSLAGARAGHAALLLADGRVLVVGGSGTGAAASPELYDPATGAWTLLDPAEPLERPDHPVGALLADGRALFAGGEIPPANGVVYGTVFDSATGAWIATGPLQSVRRESAMTLLPDGRALVTGGWPVFGAASLGSAEIYDPATNAWTPAAPMINARRGHILVRLPDGRVLAAGGVTIDGSTEEHVNSSELYDAAADTWQYAGPMPIGGAGDGALLPDGRVLFLTSEATALFKVGAGWVPVAPLPGPRHARLVALENGALMAVSGDDVNGAAQARTDLFDPVTEAWHPGRRLTRARLGHTTTRLLDGRVLAVGGFEQASAEIFELGSPGQACSTGLACASGFCADGVCCESACQDKCHSCALPGSEGQCVPAPAGEDPRRECGSGAPCADACMGDGTCGSKAGFSCGEDACAPDLASVSKQAVCVAGEEACPAITVACGGYLCQPSAAACGVTCTSSRDCAEDYACDLAGHCVPPPDVVQGDTGSCRVAAVDKRSNPYDLSWSIFAMSAAGIVLRRKRSSYVPSLRLRSRRFGRGGRAVARPGVGTLFMTRRR
ncbi:MAG: hypothetical protein U0441_24855 [Polyangiaceae bacterium]